MSDRFDESYWSRESHYRRFADYRAALESTMRWYRGLVRLVRRDLPHSGRHLDAGCGHGALVHLMLERGLDSHGVDVSEYIVAEAREAQPWLADRFEVADLEQSIPVDGSFEAITCLEVLEHVEQPDAVLEVLADRLAPGGRLIATTPNPANRFPYYDPARSDPTHISLHPPAWWGEAAATAGLVPVRLTTFWAVPLLWRLHPALSLFLPTGPAVGPGTLLVAERRR